MTISAKITNRTDITVYVMGYPLAPGKSNDFPFVMEKIPMVSSVGYVILDERGSYDSNSKLRIVKNENFNNYFIMVK